VLHDHVNGFNKLTVSFKECGDCSVLVVLRANLQALLDRKIFFLDEALDDSWGNVDFFVVDEFAEKSDKKTDVLDESLRLIFVTSGAF
jgi:hypothetical protein